MNVLLVRPDGIGDEILCLPVASAVRRLLPQATVTFLSSRVAAPILDLHPDLAAVWTVTGRESLRELVALFRQGVDAAIFLKPYRRLMWAAFLARVPIRVATGYRWYSILANRRIYEHRNDFDKHESMYNVAMLKGLGLNPPQPIAPKLVVTDEERRAAQGRLQQVAAPRVILHPGGFSGRRWRSAHYRELVEKLRECNVGVVLTGSREEGHLFHEEVLNQSPLPSGVLNLMGALSLRELLAVIAESHALVSGSTGPAHMAAACGVPTVSLFDPIRRSMPTRWQPLGNGVVLQPNVPTCEKCVYEACPYWDCLDRLTVETVVRHVREILATPSPVRVAHI